MLKTMTVSCRGGLDLSSNVQELLNKPGEAIQLQNYECSEQGGYRRISGFTETPSGVPGTGEVIGIHVVPDRGILVAKGAKLYHSFTGVDWVTLDGTFTGATEFYFADLKYTVHNEVYFTTGKTKPYVLVIEGDSPTNVTYTLREIQAPEASGATIFKDQLFIHGVQGEESNLYYSSFTDTDILVEDGDIFPQEKFSGSTSGYLNVGEDIVGLKSFRETLYIFCKNSIWKAQGMDVGQPQLLPVTRNIGCLDGKTIQEIGGNLLFLAPDGIRTVAGTEKIGDIELGVISRKVQPLLDLVLRNPSIYQFRSVVLKRKNQYRLYWSNPFASDDSGQQGLIAAYVFDPQQGPDWSYSEIKGWEVSEICQGSWQGTEQVFHGDFSGTVYLDESGNTFNGVSIQHKFQSPFVDFGDIGIRKNVHKVFLTSKLEGTVNLAMRLKYNYENADTLQPDLYYLTELNPGPIFGRAGFGTDVYGVVENPNTEVYTEGSGFTVSLQIEDTGNVDASFDIQSLVYDVIANGRI